MAAIADITDNCHGKNFLKCSDSLLQQPAALDCGISGRWTILPDKTISSQFAKC